MSKQEPAATAGSDKSTTSDPKPVIHELRRFEDFPGWVTPEDFAEFMHESLKPYEDPIDEVMRGIKDALDPDSPLAGFVLLAENERKVKGGLIMLSTGMKGYVPENFLLMVAVDPSTRGMGVGSQIIRKAFELADGDIKLHVEYDNPAKRLYERLGMTTKYAEMRYYK